MKSFLTGILLLCFSFTAFADWNLESKRIDFLIGAVEKLDATFIRNGSEYDAPTAAQHLRDKLHQVVSGPFGVHREDLTAERFIDKIASKSFLSGQPYYIKFPNGQVVLARDWLYQVLAQFQN